MSQQPQLTSVTKDTKKSSALPDDTRSHWPRCHPDAYFYRPYAGYITTESLNIRTECTHYFNVVRILKWKTCTKQVRVCDLQQSAGCDVHSIKIRERACIIVRAHHFDLVYAFIVAVDQRIKCDEHVIKPSHGIAWVTRHLRGDSRNRLAGPPPSFLHAALHTYLIAIVLQQNECNGRRVEGPGEGIRWSTGEQAPRNEWRHRSLKKILGESGLHYEMQMLWHCTTVAHRL